jgi:hypothetical protein
MAMDKTKKPRKPLPKITQKKIEEYAVYQRNRRALISAQKKKVGYTFCEICNKTGVVDCHHIVYRSEAPSHPNLHHKKNLILVCRTHHNWFHERKENRESLIQDRELWKLFNHLKIS